MIKLRSILYATVMALASPMGFSQSVYSNGFADGWQLLPWTQTTVSTMVSDSTEYLKVETGGKFGRLYIQPAKPFETAKSEEKQTLSITILEEDAAPAHELYIGLYDADGKCIKSVPASHYAPEGTVQSLKWYTLTIPLSDLNASDRLITGVVIETEIPGTFYVSAIGISEANTIP
jgi:hypothetical protein